MLHEYIALLRGINVGGNNIIKMAALKQMFEDMQFLKVKTYIQSGNVFFKANETDTEKLRKRIENFLKEQLNNTISTLILDSVDMRNIIKQKPHRFGEENEIFKYEVLFLLKPFTVQEALSEIKLREGVDEIFAGEKVVYARRLKEKLSKSYFSKMLEMPHYKNITARNWNTTQKLGEIMETRLSENII